MKNVSHKAAVSLFAVIFIISVFFGSTANANIIGGSENEEGIEQSSQVFGLLEGGSENGEEGVSVSGGTTGSVGGVSENTGEGTITGGDGSATGDSSNGEGIVTDPIVSVDGSSENGVESVSPPVNPPASIDGGSENGGENNIVVTPPVIPPTNPPSNPPTIGVPGGSGGSGGVLIVLSVPPATPSTPENIPAVAPVLPNICVSINGYARLGGNNNSLEVSKIQNFLRSYEGANVFISGIYDANTFQSVQNFQRKYAADILTPWGSDTPTGYAYITTLKKMNEISCNVFRSVTSNEAAIITAYRSAFVGGGSNTGTTTPSVPGITPHVTTTPSFPPNNNLPVVGDIGGILSTGDGETANA